MDIHKTALILIDLQNDFLHNDGAYGRAKLKLVNRRAMIEQLINVTEGMRSAGGMVISTNFTLVANKNHDPLIMEDLRKARPFLKRGDFQLGRWGHQLMDEFAPADYIVNKVTPSGFYMTHLDWLLRQLNLDTLILAGLMADGGVTSTLADAHARGYQVRLLKDGCTAYTQESMDAELQSLSSMCEIINCRELTEQLKSM